MNIKNSLLIVLFIFNFGCVASVNQVDQYKNVDFSNLYEKDRSFVALDIGITAVIDGILNTSKNATHLTKKQSKLLSEYVGQNKLFCQKGFDKKWMSRLTENLKLFEKTEKSSIAPLVDKKMQVLFSNKQC